MTAGRRPTRHDEVPDADALEQAMPVADPETIVPDAEADDPFDNDEPLIRELPPDVPEADALEQATPVDDVDDEWREHDQ